MCLTPCWERAFIIAKDPGAPILARQLPTLIIILPILVFVGMRGRFLVPMTVAILKSCVSNARA